MNRRETRLRLCRTNLEIIHEHERLSAKLSRAIIRPNYKALELSQTPVHDVPRAQHSWIKDPPSTGRQAEIVRFIDF
jgi:hypothetical protein